MVSQATGNTHTANYVNSGVRKARKKEKKKKKDGHSTNQLNAGGDY
jgi:hypothetical protein